MLQEGRTMESSSDLEHLNTSLNQGDLYGSDFRETNKEEDG